MKKLVVLTGVAVGLVVLGALFALSQPSKELTVLRKEIEALKEGQKAIQSDLQEIKNLLRARATAGTSAAEVVLSVDGAPAKGEESAKVTLVDFTDYQCPFCGRYIRETYPQIGRDYIQTGKVKYVVRDFPLESIHPLAFKAAEATHCAGERGKYWAMHDRLFANQRQLVRKDLAKHAEALGLDVVVFDQCLDTGTYAPRIRKDMAEGQKLQTTGTPTFFLGLTEPKGSEMKGTRMEGALPYEAFKAAIERLLTSPK